MIESPCINVCNIDIQQGYCRGCGRTEEEIASWMFCTDEDRQEIVELAKDRIKNENISCDRS